MDFVEDVRDFVKEGCDMGPIEQMMDLTTDAVDQVVKIAETVG
jgi:hypothetical protein